MVGTKSPSSADPTFLRKIRKPLVEKRRRDRMNNSLAKLKSLLAVNVKQNSSNSLARLDKADILELTVSQLKTLQNQQRSVSLATEADGYKRGFKDCARQTIRYLTSTQALDTDLMFRLNNHLQTCYMEKTGRTPNVPYPADAPPAHANTCTMEGDFQPAGVNVPDQQSLYGPVFQIVPGDYSQYLSEYQYYYPCNDSVNTSLNSSCNMSLDSSSSVSPEKVVPWQSSEDSVWRPW